MQLDLEGLKWLQNETTSIIKCLYTGIINQHKCYTPRPKSIWYKPRDYDKLG